MFIFSLQSNYRGSIRTGRGCLFSIRWQIPGIKNIKWQLAVHAIDLDSTHMDARTCTSTSTHNILPFATESIFFEHFFPKALESITNPCGLLNLRRRWEGKGHHSGSPLLTCNTFNSLACVVPPSPNEHTLQALPPPSFLHHHTIIKNVKSLVNSCYRLAEYRFWIECFPD